MNYYRKSVDDVVDNIKLKMQIGVLTVKISENINRINDLLEVDKDIKKDIADNSNSIKNMNKDITNNFNRISINERSIKFKTDTINSNIDEMKSTLSKINTIEENNLKIDDEVFDNRYDIINQSFNFNKNTHSYQLFEKVIENNMITGELIIKTIINYKFDDLENDINRLTHLYEFFMMKTFYFIQLH